MLEIKDLRAAAGDKEILKGITLTVRPGEVHGVKPQQVVTVFAGQDLEATSRARQYFAEYQPSSPSIALLKDGEVVQFVHRHQIEGRTPQAIAADLTAAFDRHFAATV